MQPLRHFGTHVELRPWRRRMFVATPMVLGALVVAAMHVKGRAHWTLDSVAVAALFGLCLGAIPTGLLALIGPSELFARRYPPTTIDASLHLIHPIDGTRIDLKQPFDMTLLVSHERRMDRTTFPSARLRKVTTYQRFGDSTGPTREMWTHVWSVLRIQQGSVRMAFRGWMNLAEDDGRALSSWLRVQELLLPPAELTPVQVESLTDLAYAVAGRLPAPPYPARPVA